MSCKAFGRGPLPSVVPTIGGREALQDISNRLAGLVTLPSLGTNRLVSQLGGESRLVTSWNLLKRGTGILFVSLSGVADV